jgi:excisionase family DNA binding protein
VAPSPSVPPPAPRLTTEVYGHLSTNAFDHEPMENNPADLQLSGREDLNLRPFGAADLVALHDGRSRLLRVAQVAEQLGVCAATVYRLCERGELPHVRIVNSIRIRPEDLRAFISA